MGMFDYVRCDMRTRSGIKPEGDFQTRNFCNRMERIVISAEGKLSVENTLDTWLDLPSCESWLPTYSGYLVFYAGPVENCPKAFHNIFHAECSHGTVLRLETSREYWERTEAIQKRVRELNDADYMPPWAPLFLKSTDQLNRK